MAALRSCWTSTTSDCKLPSVRVEIWESESLSCSRESVSTCSHVSSVLYCVPFFEGDEAARSVTVFRDSLMAIIAASTAMRTYFCGSLGSVPFSVELHTAGYLQPKSISDKAQTSVQPPSML